MEEQNPSEEVAVNTGDSDVVEKLQEDVQGTDATNEIGVVDSVLDIIEPPEDDNDSNNEKIQESDAVDVLESKNDSSEDKEADEEVAYNKEENEDQEIEPQEGKGEKEKKKKKKKNKDEEKRKKKEVIEGLHRSIFGDSDDEEDDVQPPEINQTEDFDLDDDDIETKSRQRLKSIASKSQEEKSRKKRKSEEGKKSKRKTKKQRELDNPEQENAGEEEDDNEPQKEVNELDLALERLKSRSSRSKNKMTKTDAEMEEMAKSFISKMDAAAEEDVLANKDQKPALNKIKMLQEAVTQLEKKMLQPYFLTCGILTTLKKWLEPLPDGSLPNMKIREALLRVLVQFPNLDAQDLKESGIGKVVMLLTKHSKESAPNKKIASLLIERWSRPIFGLNTKYSDVIREEDLEDRGERRESRRESLTTSGDLAEFDKRVKDSPKSPSSVGHARIPEKMALDFKIKPKSKVSVDINNKSKGGSTKKAYFDKQFQKLRGGPSKGGARAVQMSIEGRGLSL